MNLPDPLPWPDNVSLRQANAWTELGNADEAEKELRGISPACADHPDVMRCQWSIGYLRGQWQECGRLAGRLLREFPALAIGWIFQANWLCHENRPAEAHALLTEARERFPGDWMVAYNLARVCVRLEKLAEARDCLGQACQLRPETKKDALRDDGLSALRDWVRALREPGTA